MNEAKKRTFHIPGTVTLLFGIAGLLVVALFAQSEGVFASGGGGGRR